LATVGRILEALGEKYPWELACEGDRVGLLVGSRDAAARKAMCSVDLTLSIVERAISTGCDLLVTHHPQFFREPWHGLDLDTPGGRIAARAVEASLSIACCHTNADCAEGGTADMMADYLGLEDRRPLEPSEGAFIAKIVVFVPPEAVESVADAMAGAGAGRIGDYTRCSFRSPGSGTFLPGEGAEPYSGNVGELSTEDEVRLEMVVPSFSLGRVEEAMIEAHPYEEVAFDVYRTGSRVPWGIGRVGSLSKESSAVDLFSSLVDWTGSRRARLIGGAERVLKVAVVPGSAGSLVGEAARASCDMLVTGEAGWHAELEALESGVALALLGHSESERPIAGAMASVLERASRVGQWEMEIEVFT
jgi:dinuclear metal center YbgI/SA1388 family protein